MKEIIFGRWGDELIDRRQGSAAAEERTPTGFPRADGFPDNLASLMCGKGFLLFDESCGFVPMVREYAARIQSEYCCGKCLTGIKGTKMLLLTLDRIVAGRGEVADLALLERVADILDDAAKCSVCQSSGEMVKIGLTHFKDEFKAAIGAGVAESPIRYMSNISAPCMTNCPCHINIPAYVEMLQEVRYDRSLSIIREEMPLPGITGRVCPAPCQSACTLANIGKDPIPIKVLKRVAADYEMTHKLTPPLEKRDLTGSKVAVVGAGPAGLSAAYYLNRLGHRVTIFEALDFSGGMVRVGIPPYRQPREVLQRDVDIILGLGIELEHGVRLGRDFSIQDLLDRGFKAVLLAIGSHRSIPLGIPGEDEGIRGVFTGGIDLLRDINLGKKVEVGKRVVIVGGGNTAMDCARTCVRMGAKDVNLVYRRTRKEMPSDPEELEHCGEEGVKFHWLTQPIEIVSREGIMTGVKCIKMELGEPDKSGRRRPVPKEGSEFEMPADALIPAIGQKTNLEAITLDDGIEISRWGTIKVDERTMMTTRPGVFAAGDAVTDPLTVVHGVAGGKRAAGAIDQYVVHGSAAAPDAQVMEEILAEVEKDRSVLVTPRIEGRESSKTPLKRLDMRERVSTFDEVESGFSQAGSFIESSRCLRCYHLVLAGMAE